MRFKLSDGHQQGETRMVEKFLWIPCAIDGEMRWLEHAKIRQVFRYNGENKVGWYDTQFIDV